MHIESAGTRPDLVMLDRQAVDASVALVDAAGPADLTRPTPCGAWSLGELIAHMTAQHRGFAAAATGDARAADLDYWRPAALGADPGGAYRESAQAVLAAFAAPGALGRAFPLPEFGPAVTVPGTRAIGFHLVDYVVHAWDVARSLGRDLSVAPAVTAAAGQVAAVVPEGSARLAPGAPFAPAVPWDGADPLDRLVAFLGRDPGWPPA